jgi:hypothetical protein
MRNETIATVNGRRLIIQDSISLVGPSDEGAIVISGSHGGTISGAFAAKYPPALVVFNDAGIGKRNAGVASLIDLERAGVAGAAVSHASARIGDAADAWENGVVSRANRPAAEAGIAPGQPLQEAVKRFTSQEKLR